MASCKWIVLPKPYEEGLLNENMGTLKTVLLLLVGHKSTSSDTGDRKRD